MNVQSQSQEKTGELLWREGKLHKARVHVEKGQIIVDRTNELTDKMLEDMDMVNEQKVTVKKTSEKIGIDLQGGVGTSKPLQIVSMAKGCDIAKSGKVMLNDILLHVNGEPMLNKHLSAVKQFIMDIPINSVVELHVVQMKNRPKRNDDNGDEAIEKKEQLRVAINKGARILIHESSLALSLITSYQKGNDIPMPATLALTFLGEKKPLQLHSSLEESDCLKEWTEVISSNILEKNREKVEELKDNFDLADEFMRFLSLDSFSIMPYMPYHQLLVLIGWAFENVQSSQISAVWLKKFLVLRQDELQIYQKYPGTAEDWQRPERSYKLVDIFIRPLKDQEIPNLRSCSVVIQTPTENHVFSFEYPSPYHCWMQSIHHTRCSAVENLKNVRFKGSWNKRYVDFILDLDDGFIIEDHTTKAVYWQKEFSDLKGSSDNNHFILHLDFKNSQKEDIELRDITRCVHTMEAFMSAKVHQKELKC